MRISKALMPTLREVPAEAEIISHKLLLRAGFIRKSAAGVYSYLPLAYRVLRKIEAIVREEMDETGAQEVLLPIIQRAELWEESGRWNAYGAEMIRFKDRHNRDFCLGPTHEEVMTDLVRGEVKSYKQLPMNLYQLQNKYRDERRPRFGLMRGREFIMKDAYSFNPDVESLNESYDTMYKAYQRIFDRMGLEYRPVEADSGAIGGKETHEFMVLAENGEATIAYCTECDYASNTEVTEILEQPKELEKALELEKVETPDQKTIEEVAEFLEVSPEKTLKTLFFINGKELVGVFVRGDRSLNEIKLGKLLGSDELRMAEEEEIREFIDCPVGYLSGVGIKNVKFYADFEVKYMSNFVCGANEENYHFINANLERDLSIEEFADLREVEENDLCPKCKARLAFAKGIEVGQVFKLGTRYSESLGAKYLDNNGKEQVMLMGCYGIGVSRTMAACVEQNNDEKGIIWPKNIAPYQAVVIPVQAKNEEQMAKAEELYDELRKKGYEVALDDRKERAGVKFNDADLIGYPIRIVVGKKISEGIVEFKLRTDEEAREVNFSDVISLVDEVYND